MNPYPVAALCMGGWVGVGVGMFTSRPKAATGQITPVSRHNPHPRPIASVPIWSRRGEDKSREQSSIQNKQF